jgi:hypothetical protein
MGMSENQQRRLKAVLEAYGADPQRWPEADRLRLAGLTAPEVEAAEIDKVLALATRPRVGASAVTSILAQVAGDPAATSSVVLLRPRSSRVNISRWFAAVPIAASLALGFYVGSTGSLDALLPASLVGEAVAAGEDPGDLSGVSDIEALAEDGVT